MPLDVKPLSPLRRALMVATMLALLAAALGFAQFLVNRQDQRVVVVVGFGTPPGAEAPLVINEELDDALNGALNVCRVQSPAGPRRYVAYSLVADDQDEDVTDTDYLQFLFAHATGNSPQDLPAPEKSTLAGRPAIEIQKTRPAVNGGEDAEFAIMRLTTVDGHIVAICFSGQGILAESDKQSFAAYCQQGVHITLQRVGRGNSRS